MVRVPVFVILVFTAMAPFIFWGCTAASEEDVEAYESLPVAKAGEVSPLRRQAREEITAPQPGRYDLQALLARVDECPAMIALKEEIARETGQVIQGGFMPNPVLHFEVEMMPIDDMGFGNSKNMVMIKQRFETAGKAQSRVDMAKAAREEALARYFHKRTEIMKEVVREFCKVIFTRRKAESADRMIGLKKELLERMQGLQALGRISERDLISYQVAVEKSKADRTEFLGEERKLHRGLEGRLGLGAGAIRELNGKLPGGSPHDAKKAHEKILSRNSELIVFDRQLEKARVNLELQDSGAYPDLMVGLGYARGIENGEHDDFLGGVLEVPFPLVDRNQGGIVSAEASIRNIEASIEATAYRLLDEWHGLLEKWETVGEQRELYYGKIIPLLEKDLSLMSSQIDAGRLPVQTRLEAAVDLEEAVFAALGMDESLALTRVEMEFLCGGSY